MKKLITIFILFIHAYQISAQKEIFPSISLSETVSRGSVFTTALSFDINYKIKQVNLQTSLEYGFLIAGNISDDILNSHLLGIKLGGRFLENRTLRPLFYFSAYSEVGTNYKDKPLDCHDYKPMSFFNPQGSSTIVAESYKKTSLITHFLLGVNLNASKRMTLNFLLGYGLRIIKSIPTMNYLDAEYSTKYPLHSEYIGRLHTTCIFSVYFQFGLNYTFSFKKKPKTTTP